MKKIKNILYVFSKLVPTPIYLKFIYRIKLGKKLDLKEPETFNEKIQWLKIHNRDSRYIKMVDKYEVKKYVTSIIGEEYIIPTIGIYKKFEDINFKELPKQFVLKCTHDSGGIVICKDKELFDKKGAKKKIEGHLKINYYYLGREWPYKNVKPRIIIEKYMEDESKNELKDYKIFCFNGKAKYIQVDYNRFNGHRRNIYDTKWNLTNIQYNYPFNKDKKIEKPTKLELMLELAEKLAKDIPFVRVDFYSIIDKIFFGEITFYPEAGFGKFIPESWNRKMGECIDITNIRD